MNKVSTTKQSEPLMHRRFNCIFMALILTLSFNVKVALAQPDEPHQVDANRVTLRQGPGTQHQVITRLNKGQLVSKISEQGQWSQVRHQQTTGWMASQFLKPVTATTPNTLDTHQTKKPNYNSQAQTTQMSDQTKPTPEGVAFTVSANGVTVRRGPSTRYINFAYLNKNHKVNVIGETKSWSQIEFYTPDTNTPSQGWLASRFLIKDESAVATQSPEPSKPGAKHVEISTLDAEKTEAHLDSTSRTISANTEHTDTQIENNKTDTQSSQPAAVKKAATTLEPQRSTELSTATPTKQSSTAVVKGPFETVANNNPGIDLSLKSEQLSCEKNRQGKVKNCSLRMNFKLKTKQSIAHVKVRCGAQLSIGISNGNPIKHSLQEAATVKIQDQPHYTINADYSPKGNYTVNAVDLLSHRCAAVAYQLEKS